MTLIERDTHKLNLQRQSRSHDSRRYLAWLSRVNASATVLQISLWYTLLFPIPLESLRERIVVCKRQ